jgi:hypothetical protein
VELFNMFDIIPADKIDVSDVFDIDLKQLLVHTETPFAEDMKPLLTQLSHGCHPAIPARPARPAD